MTNYIVGVGMTHLARHKEETVKSMTADAVGQALLDAGISASEIQSAYFSNTTQPYLEGQIYIRGQIALGPLGIRGIPIFNVENACASATSALYLANQYLAAGEGDIALAVGTEKMTNDDKAKMFSVFDSGWDIMTVDENFKHLMKLGEGFVEPEGAKSAEQRSLMMDCYSAWCKSHMMRYGTTQEQIAAVSAKNHQHSVHNEKAQYRVPYSVDEILAAPPIVYPLTLPMCSPISDGSAAAILATEEGIKRLGLDRSRAVELKACVLKTSSERSPDKPDQHVSAQAAKLAYEKAGIGPEDVSVAEVHDATAMGEIIQMENMGLCDFGDGGPLAERGETSIGGRIPINPSGGLESKGHPIAATGIGMIYELTKQLRNECGKRQVEGAKIALAENSGGIYGIEDAVAAVSILARS